jgi:hypothetical protein
MKIKKVFFPFFLCVLFLQSFSPIWTVKEEERATLRGAVFSEEHLPIKGASVILLDDSFLPLQIVVTDENGKFSLTDYRDRIDRLRIQKKGFLPEDIKEISEFLKTGAIQVVLIKAAFLSGNIVDGILYTPLKDATVNLLPLRNEHVPEPSLIENKTSNEKGKYFLENLPAGCFLLKVGKEGFINVSKEIQLTTGERKSKDIFLFKKGTLQGSVKDLEGNPIKGAHVGIAKDLSPFFKTRGNRLEDRIYFATSSEGGTFSIDDIPECDGYRIALSADGFSPKIITKDILSGINTVHTSLARASSVYGTLKDENGNPVSAAEIRIQPLNQEYRKGLKEHFQESYRPAESGIFKINNLPGGSYILTIHSHDTLPFHGDFLSLKSGENKDLGELTLYPGLTITGMIQNEAGNKIEAAKITATLSRAAGKKFSKKSKSREGGAFMIPGLKEGIYTLKVEAEGYGKELKQGIRAGRSNISIILHPSGTINGSVYDAKGEPIEAFYIFAESENETPRTRKGKYFTFSMESGHYEIGQLNPGTYTLRAGASGFSEDIVRGVEVAEGTKREGIDFILKEGGRAEGYVYDKEFHLPVMGASVSVYGRESHQVLSDLNGYFLLERVPLRMVSLVIQHPDHAPTILENIDSSRAESLQPLKIFLEKGGTLEGFVLEADDSPVYGASLLVKRKGYEINSFSDLSGFYRLEHIPSGEHRIVKTLPRRDIYSDYESKIVSIGNEETLRIDFRSTLSVSGFLLKRGAPVEGARVSFIESPEQTGYSTSQLSARSSHTDSTGFYKIEGLKEGRYTVVVESGEKRFVKSANVPKVKEYHYDISFPEHEISGRVFDAESLDPLPTSEILSIPAGTSGIVIFESYQYEMNGSSSTIMGATADMQSSLTDANGFYILSIDKAGKYSMSASSNGYVSQSIDVIVEDGKATSVDFALEKSAVLRGSIKSTSGGIPSYATIFLKWNNHSKGAGIDSDGKFLFNDLKPGTYSVSIFAKDLAPQIIDQYVIEPGREYEEDFVLSRGGALTITVSPGRLPAQIQILDAYGHNFFDIFRFYLEEEIIIAHDAEKTAYSFPPLPPGKYKVILTSKELSRVEDLLIYDGVASSLEFEF